MATSTPKKSAAKKTAPKPKTREEANVAKFFEFKDRAADLDVEDQKKLEPYVLGKDKGFDPPIYVNFPDSLSGMIALDKAQREDDMFALLRILMGEVNFNRVIYAFDSATSSQKEGVRLIIGLAYTLMDHFYGQGASKVEGK